MKVLSFRIRNYKSISDSGICYLAKGVTILAGKNESGKTSILEALEDFTYGRQIRETAQPLRGKDVHPEITVTFEVEGETLRSILGDRALQTLDSVEVDLIKSYPASYSLGGSAQKKLRLPAAESAAGAGPDLITAETFTQQLLPTIPNFILFSSFDDILPSEIPLQAARDNPLIQDIVAISDLDLSVIQSGSAMGKIAHKNDLNIRLRNDYTDYWTQDVSHLGTDWDSNNLIFYVKEDDDFYKPEMRSKGKQWHLAFYIRITARSREDVANVILIDEPGLFLHAAAQRDILRKLEDSSVTAPVIFATHSPYLLEADKLDRIRLITRTATDGTTIANSVHKGADKETLTPILTAIGLEISNGIANIDKSDNVVVEGPSDWFYLQALREVVGVDDVNFVYGGGAGSMPMVHTILSGWGCHVLLLFDHDKGKRDVERAIARRWLVEDSAMLTPTDVPGEAIEDVFSRQDFKTLVLRELATDYDGSNSAYVKKAGLRKTLLAREFLCAVRRSEVCLDAETKMRAQGLFERIRSSFETVYSAD